MNIMKDSKNIYNWTYQYFKFQYTASHQYMYFFKDIFFIIVIYYLPDKVHSKIK